MSTIKINRALKASDIGSCPGSALAMIDRIPADVVDALPSRLVARLTDAMWKACQESKAIANADAISEGAVWDARRQQFRDLA